MTSRAMLHEKSLDELRVIAASVGVTDHESLQKSKLIAAILGSDAFDASSEPAPVELPAVEERRSPDGQGGAEAEEDLSGESADRQARVTARSDQRGGQSRRDDPRGNRRGGRSRNGRPGAVTEIGRAHV